MPWKEVPEGWDRTRQEIIDRHGLAESELHSLRIYNQESARGIMHTPEWKWRMASIQERVNRQNAEIQAAFERVMATA